MKEEEEAMQKEIDKRYEQLIKKLKESQEELHKVLLPIWEQKCSFTPYTKHMSKLS